VSAWTAKEYNTVRVVPMERAMQNKSWAELAERLTLDTQSFWFRRKEIDLFGKPQPPFPGWIGLNSQQPVLLK
jgi:hypothetical protein